MRRHDAAAWVVKCCAASLRLSQAKTLAALVAGALSIQRVSLSAIGRQMAGRAKHQIKRCWRFTTNPRVETADAMRGIVQQLLRQAPKALVVAIDWVDIRGFQTLMAAAVLKGRAVPICWASTTNHEYEGHRSRNAFEESLLLVLRTMIPDSVKVIILGDRGFGRCALAAFCRQHHFDYLIRIGPKVKVKCKGFAGKLLDYPVNKGIATVLKDVAYRSDGAVTQNIVVLWKRHLPLPRDECWFLMTSLKGTAAKLCSLYGRRMTIEQLFRDLKSKRNGWSLRDTQLTTPQRLDRLLLILAIAYLLLCGLGLIAQATSRPSDWSSGSKTALSCFQIGLLMVLKLPISPQNAWTAVLRLAKTLAAKWG
jgi:hypothetical protein